MSMENAILELADGMKALAVAVRESAIMNAECTKLNGEMMLAQARQFNTAGKVLTPEAELEEAVTKVEKDAALKKAAEAGMKTKAEVKAADDEEAKREASAAAKGESMNKAEDNLIGTDDKVLDYKADVTPLLLAMQKKTTKLKELLAEFGCTKGDQLKVEQYPAIMARAKEMMAA